MATTSVSLLQRVRSNDDAAWKTVVSLYTPFLRYWARRGGLDGAEVDDLVQDVFLKAIQMLPTFTYDANRSFRAWLRTIAVNGCRERFRRKKVVGRGTGDAGLSGVTSERELEESWDQEHQQAILVRALELMKQEFEEKTWQACWELTVNERTAADVAAELGMTANACFLAKSRVIRRLRVLLDGLWE
jgi:RNA polymerase sigma-70 factor (ECF subfamily)